MVLDALINLPLDEKLQQKKKKVTESQKPLVSLKPDPPQHGQQEKQGFAHFTRSVSP